MGIVLAWMIHEGTTNLTNTHESERLQSENTKTECLTMLEATLVAYFLLI